MKIRIKNVERDTKGADKMKKKLLTVLMISAMVLTGNTVAKADDVFDSNTEKSLEIDMDTKKTSEANPEDVISISEEIAEEDSDKEKNTEDSITTYADDIAIDEEHFPDEGFRKYLKDNRYLDKDGDGYFSQDEINDITSIAIWDVELYKIKSLVGINYFTNLTHLACPAQGLIELDVSQNPNLTSLDCHNNQLTSLDVSGNPNVVNLACDSNQLTSLDVSKNPNLSSLSCRSNQLTSLDVSKNPNLSSLGCGNNQLVSLNVSKNPNLSSLSCGSNQLTSLDISKNLNLGVLDCADNQLTSLDVNVHLNLRNLWCSGNHLSKLELSNNKQMFKRNTETLNPMHGTLEGAYVTPQDISANIISTNGIWTLDLAAIVGKENLNRVTLATDGAKLSADGTVTFSGSTMPTELVYNYDTKNPAEDTPMTVHVALTRDTVDDQTGKDVTVDTGDLDIDKICKENNISINTNFEIILSQGTPSKVSLDKLTQAAGKNGYSIKATYKILMSLLSDGQKITDITDNFGRIKLTFKVNASLAGQNAIVYQLHNNSQVIVHDGLTVNTDGTVTITVDKLSTFAVAVKPSLNNTDNNTGKPNTNQPGTNKPDSNRPNTNQSGTNKPDTNQPDSNKSDMNQPNVNKPDESQTNVKQTNTNQLSPKTGDSINPVIWLFIAITASITGILNRKRFYKH